MGYFIAKDERTIIGTLARAVKNVVGF